MEITVIDDSDFVGDWNALFTFGDISMTSVRSMVDNVLKESCYRKIARLNIVDHGSRSLKKDGDGEVMTDKNGNPKVKAVTLQFGNDKVSRKTFDGFVHHFDRLTEKFDRKGLVHFCHCWAGQDVPLLARFAALWSVPVWAGLGKDANWAGVNGSDPPVKMEGIYVRVTPDGKHKKFSSRP